MILIILSILFISLLLISTGNALLNVIKWEPENIFLAFWLGFFVVTGIGLASSLFLPLDSAIPKLFVFAIFLCGFPATVRTFTSFIAKNSIAKNSLFFLPLLLGLIAISLSLAHECLAYDTDLYHAQIVRWLREYGSPAGLGNLHGRLAQTSIWLILAAQIEVGPLVGCSAFIMPGVSILGALAYFFYATCYSSHTQIRLFSVIILGGLALQLVKLDPNLYFDRPALFIYLVSCAELLTIFISLESKNTVKKTLIVFFILTAASFLTKMLTPISIVIAMMLLGICMANGNVSLRDATIILALPALSALLLLARNVLVSGWGLFPVSFFLIPVDWAMPKDAVQGLARAVWGWARLPGPDYLLSLEKGFSFWILPWLTRHLTDKFFWIAVVFPFILGTFLWLYAFAKPGAKKAKFFFFFWSGSNIIYWFCSAPDYRFGIEFFWGWLALAAIFGIDTAKLKAKACNMIPLHSPHCHRLANAAVLPLLAAGLLVTGAVFSQAWLMGKHGRGLYLFAPKSLQPRPGLQEKQIPLENGGTLTLYIAPQGDDRCGNAPLPCSPSPDPSACLRFPYRLKDGFIPCN